MNIQFLIAVIKWSFYGAAVKQAASDWTGADLTGVERGGIINEDVMQQIWDISNVSLPFSDKCSGDTIGNASATWTQDKLSDPDVSNAVVDGAVNTKSDAKGGARVGNQSQISTKAVSVSTRARNSNVVGRSDELAYQISRRQIDLKRDREAIMLFNQGSQVDDGDTVPGKLGGLPAWMVTNFDGGAGSTLGGYNPATGLVAPFGAGAPRAIGEIGIRDMIQSIYQQGGDTSCMMSVPDAIRAVSEYMFTDTARVATLQSDQGKSREAAAALGTVNYFVADFGSVQLEPNRIQQFQLSVENVAEIHFIDFSLVREGTLAGYRVEPLAKVGLADERQMSVDATLKVLNEAGCGLYCDVDTTVPMVLGT
jgi:hypothetical protein